MKSLTRLCKECGRPYKVHEKGAGYKYCSRYCAKKAQMRQIEKWENENLMTVKEWRQYWANAKCEEDYENYSIANSPKY